MKHRISVLCLAAVAALLPSTYPIPASALSVEFICDVTGYSIDTDVNGLNVRENPSSNAKVVGKIYTLTDDEGRTHPLSRIHEIRDGWAFIAATDATTESGGASKKNYTGKGWVALSKFGGHAWAEDIYSPKNKSYAGPGLDTKVVDPDGQTNVINMEREFGSPPKLLDCKGEWIKQQYRQSGALNDKGKWVKYSPAERAKRKPVQAWFFSGRKA